MFSNSDKEEPLPEIAVDGYEGIAESEHNYMLLSTIAAHQGFL